MQSLEIYKDKRNKGKFHHKGRFGQTATKKQAWKDISEECGEGKLYSKNWVVCEARILEYIKGLENQ